MIYLKLFLTAILATISISSWSESGVIFTSTTPEGIPMQFVVTNESQKTAKVYGEHEHKLVMIKQDGTKVYRDYYYPSIDNEYTGTITIPNTVNGYSITEISHYAFYGCKLSYINIPSTILSIDKTSFNGCGSLVTVNINSNIVSGNNRMKDLFGGQVKTYILGTGITSIGDYVFSYCDKISEINIPETVTNIGNYAFIGCNSLTSIYIPKNVTNIGSNPFCYCYSMESIIVDNENPIFDSRNNCNAIIKTQENALITGIKNTTIPDGVEEIGIGAFQDCSGLTTIIIPNSVTTIDNYAFYGCSDLSSAVIGNNVKKIGSYAFNGCSVLSSLAIPNSITEIDWGAFPQDTKLYVHKGSTALLALWNEGYTPYETDTEAILERPSLSIESTTQSTTVVKVDKLYSEYTYAIDEYLFTGDEATIKGLRPDYTYTFYLRMTLGDYSYSSIASINATTAPISPTVSIVNKTASSFLANGSYSKGDATISSMSMKLDSKIIEGNVINAKGLQPNNTYEVIFVVTVKYGNNLQYTDDFTGSKSITTDALNMTTEQPKVISLGNVIVSAQANVDDAEENVGFEWRRTDWTDDFASNTGQAYVYEGTMEGYIRNLNTEKLWKYRPYYLSDSGTYYYGDWVGIDPTNTSYFEPTVHTYAAITIEGNTALVKGYALRGTDNITVQGFKYWKNASGARGDHAPLLASAIPADAQTVEAEGYVMEASLTGLDFNSEYCYVAFVKTSEGETFYGEQRTFTTGEDPTGIDGIRNDNANGSDVHEVARYNMQGLRITSPERGLNIVRMSDGTVRKVMVK